MTLFRNIDVEFTHNSMEKELVAIGALEQCEKCLNNSISCHDYRKDLFERPENMAEKDSAINSQRIEKYFAERSSIKST